MEGRGVRLEGHVFRPGDEAKTIRVRDDEVRITEGTAAADDERIAGFNILECRDLDEALEVHVDVVSASSAPFAHGPGFDFYPR